MSALNLSICLLTLLLFFYSLVKWKNRTFTKKSPPKPSGAWPIIGHLHLLGGLTHITLGKFADKYGPIFMINLGVNNALVISSPAMAKQCLGTNDSVFVNRPQTVFVEHLGYKSAMLGFRNYGSYWRKMRKIATIELLSNHRLETFRGVRMSVVRSAIKRVYDTVITFNSCESVDMKSWFHNVSLNNIVRIIAGNTLQEFYNKSEEYNRISKALLEFFELGGVFVPADSLPFLRWFDIGGYEKTMKGVAKEIDYVAEEWLEMHKRKGGDEKQDFMDVLLGMFQGENNEFEFDANVIVKATSMALILAATDTTAVTLTWALSLLLNNKETLSKTRAELDTIVGKERQVEESDLKNLVYLQAVLKETLRLYPAGPLSVPRESVSDCTVNEYHIPARTQLFVNLYKIHRDPATWEDSCEFLPERFLTTHKDFDFRGQSFEYMPFGSGRRICPGINFAVQFMELTLANLVHGFEMSSPMDRKVDMSERFGLTNLKVTPLDVVLTPRLPGQLYRDS